MNAAPTPQPALSFGVPWSVALVFVGAGILLLGFAIFRITRTPPDNRSDISGEIAQLQEQLAGSEAQLAALRDRNKIPAADLKTRIESNTLTAGRLAAREVNVKQLEEKNSKAADAAQSSFDAAQKKEQQQLDAATALVAQRADKGNQPPEMNNE